MHTPTQSDSANNSSSYCRRARQSDAPTSGYGLRREVLSPMETLAQSVSTMAPTTTPAATIPLVCALGRQCHVARLCAGHGGRAAGGVVHWALRALLGLARIALYLRRHDASSLARGHGGLELAAGLCGHGFQRDWRLLSLRQPAAPARRRARGRGGGSGHAWSPAFPSGLPTAT